MEAEQLYFLFTNITRLAPANHLTKELNMNIKGKVAVITGAAGGIGRATAMELANRQIGSLALVDKTEAVHELAKEINQLHGRAIASGYTGDVTEETFRSWVYRDLHE